MIIALAVVPVLSAEAVDRKQERMLANLAIVETIFWNQYAPAEWKEQHSGWKLNSEINKVASKIRRGEVRSVKEYHQALAKFFHSTVDYHVGVRFIAKEAATLPMQIKGAAGKYFLVHIDRSKLSESDFPFQVGDEVVKFNGKSVRDELNSLLPFVSNGNPETREALAELRLTSRGASRGMPVPQTRAVRLDIRKKGSRRVERANLEWDYTAESAAFIDDNTAPLDEIEVEFDSPFLAEVTGFAPFKSNIFNRQMAALHLVEDAPEAPANPNMAENLYQIGGKKSFVPDLGEKEFEHDRGFFHTRIFKLPNGKKIGMVRIPSYGAGAQETSEFVQIVELLEQETDALVIDQVNNPGGSVPFLYSLVSLLSGKEMFAPYHRMALTQADVVEAEQNQTVLERITNEEEAHQIIGPTIGGYPVTMELVQNFLRYTNFIVNEWRAGNRLTNPFFLVGVDKIKPHPKVNYSKPILILVNNLDFSGGDFFPAIMQDNGRAKIMGTRTAGAGGYVLSAKFPNLMGLEEMNLTGSIAERIDDNPIENLGVTPDVEYKISPADIQGDMSSYKAAILRELATML